MSAPDSPLARKRVLIACSDMKAEKLASGLTDLGADVTVFPVISMVPAADKAPLDNALDRLQEFAWIIFTSAYGVRYFLNRMAERGMPVQRCDTAAICAVGPATAQALHETGKRVSLIPEKYDAEGILAALGKKHGGLHALEGLRILLPRAREARDLLPDTLRAHGALVDAVPCYENRMPQIRPDLVRAILARPPELVVFTSSSTVNNFLAILGIEEGRNMLARARVAALGPITCRTLAAHGKDAEIVPCESTIDSLLERIGEYFTRER